MLDVLYEDNHLLAVTKPAMLPTMGVAEERPSLLVLAREYIRRKYSKPGNVYLGIVSRLDVPVTGVVLMARTSKAAARLTEMFRERDVEKTYWTLVEGRVDPPQGKLVNELRKDERHRRMHVVGPGFAGAQRAELEYRVLDGSQDQQTGRHGDKGTQLKDMIGDGTGSLSASLARCMLLEIRLLTGRKHQIRVQLAEAGWPVLGDRKYGSTRKFPVGIALHARRLALEHPVRRTPLVIESALPAAWLK
jgi:23S rRNA pseudouridine1911/1915/1917 synthase